MPLACRQPQSRPDSLLFGDLRHDNASDALLGLVDARIELDREGCTTLPSTGCSASYRQTSVLRLAFRLPSVWRILGNLESAKSFDPG